MTAHPVNTNIPNANNPPRDDQPGMKTNFANLVATWGEDHYDPNNSNAGTHQFVRFPAVVSPSAPAGESAVAYTALGSANNAVSQYYFQNSIASLLLSGVRAFGLFSLTNGVTTFLNSYNCSTLAIASGTATVTLTANAVTGTDFIVIPFIYSTGIGGAAQDIFFTKSSGSFTLFTGQTNPANLIAAFVVLQA